MFNVIVSDVTAMVMGTTIDATSTPNTTQVEDWITTTSGMVEGIFQSKGVDPTSFETNSPGYSYGRKVVLYEVASQLMYAVQGRFDQAESFSKKSETWLTKLEQWSARIGNDARTSLGSVDTPVSTSGETMRDLIDAQPLSLRASMVRSNMM